ncbi:hypothetical protein Tco_0511366 [Tanacetum coccineum]
MINDSVLVLQHKPHPQWTIKKSLFHVMLINGKDLKPAIAVLNVFGSAVLHGNSLERVPLATDFSDISLISSNLLRWMDQLSTLFSLLIYDTPLTDGVSTKCTDPLFLSDLIPILNHLCWDDIDLFEYSTVVTIASPKRIKEV